MNRMVWIDWSRNSGITPHPEAVVVDDHVTFLRELDKTSTLFIRGHGVGQWASTLAVARDWECRDVVDPIAGLREAVPELSKSEAADIVERLGQRYWDVVPDFMPLDLARVLHPQDLWEVAEADDRHAVRWLLWIAEGDKTPSLMKIYAQAAGRWAGTSADSGPNRGYSVSTPKEAIEVLEEWLGLSPTEDYWPAFPALPIPPDVSSELLKRFRSRLDHEPRVSVDLVHGRAFPSGLMSGIASNVFSLLRDRPEFLRESLVEWLAGYLPNHQTEQLRNKIRPDDPGLPPASFADVPGWFQEFYLPWRKWSARNLSDSTVHSRVIEIGRSFAEAYLGELQRQVQMSGGQRVLTWQRTQELLSKRDGVITLLVALDGLSFADLPNFMRHFREWAPELTVQASDVVGVPLPTVTPFTKPALMTGSTPAVADPEGKSGSHRISSKFSELLESIPSAKAGDVIVWRHIEPDHTYHHDLDREGLKYSVDNELRKIAQQISALSDSAPLRVNFE